MSNSLNPLIYKSLRQHVRVTLRAAIMEGRFPPGSRLLEEQIAAQLGISRAPVREALRELELEGLVKSEPHRGTFVKAPQTIEIHIRELFSLRAVLEGLAARIVATDPNMDFAILQAFVDEIKQAAEAQEHERIHDRDLEFHRKVVELSRHALLNATYGTIYPQIRGICESVLPTVADRLGMIIKAHQKLVNVLKGGDPEAAEALLRRHIVETGDLLLQHVQSHPEKGGDQQNTT